MNNFTFQGSMANSLLNSPPSQNRNEVLKSKFLESEKDSSRKVGSQGDGTRIRADNRLVNEFGGNGRNVRTSGTSDDMQGGE